MPATLPINTPKDKTLDISDILFELMRHTRAEVGDYDNPTMPKVTPLTYHFVMPESMREKCYERSRPGKNRKIWGLMDFEVVFREDVYSIDFVPKAPIVPDNPLPFDELGRVE